MPSVAFIGMGVMGFPMAGHLQQQGHRVTVYNRTTAKAEQWVTRYGGLIASTPAEAAKGADYVLACVGNDDDVRSVTLGPDGAFNTMNKGAVFIDHTTTSATLSRELYTAAAERGLHAIDAPVSGGQQGAENGALTVMVGGDQSIVDGAMSVLEAYSQKVVHIGPAGSGQLAKMVNQICIAGVVQGLSEGLRFGENAGLDMNLVLDVISKGSAQSWQMVNRGKTMLEKEFDFGFAVDWMRKDLNIAFDEAKRNGSELPTTRIIDDFYSKIQESGGNRLDTSSLITLLKERP